VVSPGLFWTASDSDKAAAKRIAGPSMTLADEQMVTFRLVERSLRQLFPSGSYSLF